MYFIETMAAVNSSTPVQWRYYRILRPLEVQVGRYPLCTAVHKVQGFQFDTKAAQHRRVLKPWLHSIPHPIPRSVTVAGATPLSCDNHKVICTDLLYLFGGAPA